MSRLWCHYLGDYIFHLPLKAFMPAWRSNGRNTSFYPYTLEIVLSWRQTHPRNCSGWLCRFKGVSYFAFHWSLTELVYCTVYMRLPWRQEMTSLVILLMPIASPLLPSSFCLSASLPSSLFLPLQNEVPHSLSWWSRGSTATGNHSRYDRWHPPLGVTSTYKETPQAAAPCMDGDI